LSLRTRAVMSGALSRRAFTPSRRPRRRPRLGDRERGPDRPGLGDSDVSSHAQPAAAEEAVRHSDESGRVRGAAHGRVLIVDDEQSIRFICRVNLRSAGFETLEASDGEAALALARSERPDLILLDVMLPAVDGWRVAEELAASEDTREIPIVFLSARSEPADQRRGHEFGGVGYIKKPFDATALPEVVAHTIDRVRRGERDAVRREWLEELGD
jgi:CheY-like chemotaxis protein